MTKDEAMTAYADAIAKLTSDKDTAEATTNINEIMLNQIAFPRKTRRNQFKEMKLETIKTKCDDFGIANVILNRPKRGNSFNMQMWSDFRSSFDVIEHDDSIRVVLLSGAHSSAESNAFSTGMDLDVFKCMDAMASRERCVGRQNESLMKLITYLQDVISSPERCCVPVIAMISGHCIGGAVDLITACDMRYCTDDARFSIKETDLAMVIKNDDDDDDDDDNAAAAADDDDDDDDDDDYDEAAAAAADDDDDDDAAVDDDDDS